MNSLAIEMECYLSQKDALPDMNIFSGEDLINLNIFDSDFIAIYRGRPVAQLSIFPIIDARKLSGIYYDILLEKDLLNIGLKQINKRLGKKYKSMTVFFKKVLLRDSRVASFIGINEVILGKYHRFFRVSWKISTSNDFYEGSATVKKSSAEGLDIAGPIRYLNHAPTGLASRVYLVARNAGQECSRIINPKYLRLFQESNLRAHTKSIDKPCGFPEGLLMAGDKLPPSIENNIFI